MLQSPRAPSFANSLGLGMGTCISLMKTFSFPVSGLRGEENKEKGVAFLATTGESPPTTSQIGAAANSTTSLNLHHSGVAASLVII